MKIKRNAVKTLSYAAGIFAVSAALLAAVILAMCAAGILFPRKQKLVLESATVAKVYDGTPLSGGNVSISYGSLHASHHLVTVTPCEYTKVGEYTNEPTYMILDASGTDVTKQYEISTVFGTLTVEGRPITVQGANKQKKYDGTPLESDPIYLLYGTLANGHTLISEAAVSLTEPGEEQIPPAYRIVDQSGVDMTDQYLVEEVLGTVTVVPRPLKIRTGSAEKFYDGTPLSSDEWELVEDTLLEGHKLTVKCITEKTEAGTFDNLADVSVFDSNGNNVSELYKITLDCGTLTISPKMLYIQTGSASKEYDGTPLSCDVWAVTAGTLEEGETLTMIGRTERTAAGSAANEMQFTITDRNGADVTHRYQIDLTAGTLSVTPRAITIRTGSASKVYDGTALTCEEYEFIKGSLCEGDTITLAFTSVTSIGYSQNYIVEYTVYKTDEEGRLLDVSGNYRISYDYGTLTVTAD